MTSLALLRRENGDSDRALRGGETGDGRPGGSGFTCFVSALSIPDSDLSPRNTLAVDG